MGVGGGLTTHYSDTPNTFISVCVRIHRVTNHLFTVVLAEKGIVRPFIAVTHTVRHAYGI